MVVKLSARPTPPEAKDDSGSKSHKKEHKKKHKKSHREQPSGKVRRRRLPESDEEEEDCLVKF